MQLFELLELWPGHAFKCITSFSKKTKKLFLPHAKTTTHCSVVRPCFNLLFGKSKILLWGLFHITNISSSPQLYTRTLLIHIINDCFQLQVEGYSCGIQCFKLSVPSLLPTMLLTMAAGDSDIHMPVDNCNTLLAPADSRSTTENANR